MIARWQEKEIVSALKYRRVVNLTGARQCGKTTLAGIVPLASASRFTLDDDETRKAAASDPYGFVERKDGETFVIDEIQKVPELLNAIKRSSGRGVLPSSTMPRNSRPRTFRPANGTSRPTRHSCSSRARRRS